jgi:uncharacterized membrane protein
MLYQLLKAAHLVSLFVWIGGMVAVALSLRHAPVDYLKPLKSYDRAVTTPAMVLAWAFGITLAVQGNWFTDIWMMAKILLVLVLSGLHGASTGRLRRSINADRSGGDARAPVFLPLGLALVTLIVLLVTTKPF